MRPMRSARSGIDGPEHRSDGHRPLPHGWRNAVGDGKAMSDPDNWACLFSALAFSAVVAFWVLLASFGLARWLSGGAF
jgi:hypothetical protein